MFGFRVGVFEVRVWGMGFSRFGVSGSLFRVCEVPGFRYGVMLLGVRVRCFGVRGFAVRGFGVRVTGGSKFSRFGVLCKGFPVGFFDVRGFWGLGFAYGVFEVGFRVRGFTYGVTGSWFGFFAGSWLRGSGFRVRGSDTLFRDSGFRDRVYGFLVS